MRKKGKEERKDGKGRKFKGSRTGIKKKKAIGGREQREDVSM